MLYMESIHQEQMNATPMHKVYVEDNLSPQKRERLSFFQRKSLSFFYLKTNSKLEMNKNPQEHQNLKTLPCLPEFYA